MTLQLTNPPPGGRGCGTRKAGGTYACVGVGPNGLPWNTFMFDPAVPYAGDRFRGVQEANEELRSNWQEGMALLLDMVGAEHYPTVPSFVEEVRRFGMSRQVPETFDWTKIAGREVWLGLVHWKARHVWADGTEELPPIEYAFCDALNPAVVRRIAEDGEKVIPIHAPHYPDCVYHLWPLCSRVHETSEGLVEMPGFRFDPLNVVRNRDPAVPVSPKFPDVDYLPALFAAFPVTHVEAVGYVPEGSNASESGLPVVVVEE